MDTGFFMRGVDTAKLENGASEKLARNVTEAQRLAEEMLERVTGLLVEEMKAVKLERNALLHDLRMSDRIDCVACKQNHVAHQNCDLKCDRCRDVCVCRTCENGDKWEWRGLCPENTGVADVKTKSVPLQSVPFRSYGDCIAAKDTDTCKDVLETLLALMGTVKQSLEEIDVDLSGFDESLYIKLSDKPNVAFHVGFRLIEKHGDCKENTEMQE